MKTTIITFRKLFLTLIFIFTAFISGYSQGTQIISGGEQKLFIGLAINPAQTHLACTETDALKGIKSDGGITFTFQAEGGYFFSNKVGISAGIGFTPLKNSLSLATYKGEYDDTDSDLESFEMSVTGTNIIEDINLTLINIPLNIVLRFNVNDKIGIYIQPGINLMLPVGNKFSSNGVFTYKGYYPAYNITLEGLPDFGFPKDYSTSSEGSAVLKSLCINGLINTGISYRLNDKLDLLIGASFDRSFATLAGTASIDTFQLSPGVDELKSMTDGLSDIRAQSIGMRVGIRYYLK